MKNELGALMLWIDRKLNKNHDALVTKIDAIQNLFETSSEASASAADILEGKTAFNGTNLMTGTMVNQESREATLLAGGTYNIPRGYHDGTGRVTATDLASQTAGTATAGGILQGLKAWVAGRMIDGTMKDRRGVTVTAGTVTQDDEYTYLSIPEEACYNANSKVRTPNSNISNMCKKGTFTGTGQGTTNTINVGFKPTAVFLVAPCPGYGINVMAKIDGEDKVCGTIADFFLNMTNLGSGGVITDPSKCSIELTTTGFSFHQEITARYVNQAIKYFAIK